MSIETVANSAVAFSVPLRLQFRANTNREGVVFEGPSGWGEFAPFANYDDVVAGHWLAAALEMAFGQLPENLRTSVPVNAIIPEVDEITAYELVQRAVKDQGIETIKVKVAQPGQSLADDIARVRAVRSALSDSGAFNGLIRLDANTGWNVETAVTNISKLSDAANGLDYVEQPCETLGELTELKKHVDVKIAIDEGVRLADELDILAIRDAADVLIAKPIPLGGVTRSLRLIDRIDLPVVVSGSMDTSIGLQSGLQLAASVPNLYGPCGLGTGALLALDLIPKTEQPQDGMLLAHRQNPDSNCLALAHALTSSRDQEFWRSRIMNAWHASAHRLVSPDVKQAVLAW